MINKTNSLWKWNDWDIAWSLAHSLNAQSKVNLLLIHGFGASQQHWRHNQTTLGQEFNCYAIDLLGFGNSSQPSAILDHERKRHNHVKYCFDLWGNQIADFCKDKIKSPVFLIGNSIGGIVSLKGAQLLGNKCKGLILIDCAQRTMDDKRLKKGDILMNFARPVIKTFVSKRFVSKTLFKRAANPKVIKQILKTAYPSGNNIDEELIDILYKPSQRSNSSEAFRGFINLFDDYLATDLFGKIKSDIHLIWGENDPWESLEEAKKWEIQFKAIKSLNIIKSAGHCPHDEKPEETNSIIKKIIQDTK